MLCCLIPLITLVFSSWSSTFDTYSLKPDSLFCPLFNVWWAVSVSRHVTTLVLVYRNIFGIMVCSFFPAEARRQYPSARWDSLPFADLALFSRSRPQLWYVVSLVFQCFLSLPVSPSSTACLCWCLLLSVSTSPVHHLVNCHAKALSFITSPPQWYVLFWPLGPPLLSYCFLLWVFELQVIVFPVSRLPTARLACRPGSAWVCSSLSHRQLAPASVATFGSLENFHTWLPLPCMTEREHCMITLKYSQLLSSLYKSMRHYHHQ